MSLGDRGLMEFAGGLGGRLAITSVLYPIEYSKTLIQIGFEPLPAKPARTLFGKPTLAYPNIFHYAGYIRSVHGTCGLFTGLGPHLCMTAVTNISHGYISDKFVVLANEDDEKQKEIKFAKKLTVDICATTTSIILSQPFHVIAVRMMAQFVGGETKYSGILDSFLTIYREEGITGWFSGLVPRLIGEVATLFCVSSLRFIFNTYVVKEGKNIQQVLSLCFEYAVKNLFYPLYVVNACMAVNGSGLRAGSPPFMPNYSGNWLRCWNDLCITNQKKRGSSLFWRYTTPALITSSPIPLPMPEKPKYK